MPEKPPRAPQNSNEIASSAKPKTRDRERRRARKPPSHSEVRFDAKGNPVWHVRVDVPMRRKDDDDTFDFLKCLDVEGLSLSEDEPERKEGGVGYDPYGHHNKK
jgi:hypothetical protein